MANFFVEIGTSDFDTCYQLAEQGWHGIQVEPVKELLDRIPDHPNIIKVNKVVSDYNGEISFHVSDINNTDKKNDQHWVRGISSVAADNHKGRKMFEFANGANKPFLMETRNLPCITLDALLQEFGVEKIDYLKMDTEGHETNIIEAYSWGVRPSTIKLEHSHIDDQNMKRILEEQGYIVYVEKRDIYAIG